MPLSMASVIAGVSVAAAVPWSGIPDRTLFSDLVKVKVQKFGVLAID
jgi:hypothetical protein